MRRNRKGDLSPNVVGGELGECGVPEASEENDLRREWSVVSNAAVELI